MGFWFLRKVGVGSRLGHIIEHVCLCVKGVMSPLDVGVAPPHPEKKIANNALLIWLYQEREGEWGMLTGVSDVQGTHKGHPYGDWRRERTERCICAKA